MNILESITYTINVTSVMCLRTESYGYPVILGLYKDICLQCGHSYVVTSGCNLCKNNSDTRSCYCFPKYPMTEEEHEKYMKVRKRIFKMMVTKGIKKDKKLRNAYISRQNLKSIKKLNKQTI